MLMVTAMENVAVSWIIKHGNWSQVILKSRTTRGLYYNQPGNSCRDIRDSGFFQKDGEFWIDPEKNGRPLKVYCDMTTDGGKKYFGKKKKINEGVVTLRIYRNNNWNRHRILCPDFIRFFQEVGFLFLTLWWTTRDSFRLSLLTVKLAPITTTRRCSSRRMPWKNWEHTCPSLSWDFIAINKWTYNPRDYRC